MDIDVFLKETYTPTDKQQMAHDCLERYILYGGAVGGGKSVWGSMEGVDLNWQFPGNVGLICRWELSSLKRTTLETFLEFCPDLLVSNHNKQEGLITMPNASKIIYMGLKPSQGVNALSRLGSLNLGWFFIDEAIEVPKKYFDMLKTRLRLRLPDGTFPKYKGLLASNPDPGWVRDIFIDQSLEDHAFIPALPGDNPHNPPDYVENLRRDLPPELIAKLVEGSWDVWEGDNYIFPYSWVKAAIDRTLEPGEPKEAGLDVGGGGDESVLAIRRGPVVRIAHTSRYVNTMRAVAEISPILDREEPEVTRVDSIGIGQPIHDRLKELNYSVSKIIAGGKAQKPEKFTNAKAEDHWGFRLRLEAEDVDLPDDPVLRSQLVSIKYDTLSDRKIKVESKKERAAQGLPSPDRAEAVINAFAVGKKRRKGRIAA